MRFIPAIVVGLCVVFLALAGGSLRSSNVDQAGPSKELGARAFLHGDSQSVSPEEWSEIEAWMKVNCPNRVNFLGQLGEGQGMKEHAKQLMADQYRQIKHTTYKPLQDALVQQAQAQDLIFGAQVKLREARREHEKPQRDAAKATLRTAVGKLFDAAVQERSARVGRLELEIDNMRKNRTSLIDEWTRGMISKAGVSVPGSGSTVPDPESSSPGETGSSLPE